MKRFVFAFAAVAMSVTVSAFAGVPQQNKTDYGIHLFFDEKEYVDVLTLESDTNGHLSGKMHVPDDFDARLDNLHLTASQISFDILVPKNRSRSEDMIFHYQGSFFSNERKQLTGFVTVKDKTDFVASFVGFLR